MTAVKVNSLIKIHTLSLLHNGPKHGYEIIKSLETNMKRTISASHVYPFLKLLEDNSLINYQKVEERDKKKYYLTKKGKEFVNLIFNNIQQLMSSFLENKISICEGCGCKIYENKYVQAGSEKSYCCKHCAYASEKKRIVIQESWQIKETLKTV